jgi:hypothetical protein
MAIMLPALFFCVGSNVAVQGQTCGVGTRVEFEDGARGIGTIQEIGTESPHVGWYRIVFSWNSPKGDWYSPKNWGILIAGSKTKCGQETAGAKPAPRSGGNEPRAGQIAGAGGNQQAGCPMIEPPGKVTRTSTASAQLFKRVIYERAAAKINPGSISAPKQVGLTFLEFTMGEPYKNTLTSSRFGDKRRHDGAPVDAMIYPLKTREMLCESYGNEVRRWVAEVSHDCFKNRDGDWTCPGRTTKVIENTLIPVK